MRLRDSAGEFVGQLHLASHQQDCVHPSHLQPHCSALTTYSFALLQGWRPQFDLRSLES